MPAKLSEALRAWWPARVRHPRPAERDRVPGPARIERYGGLTALYLAGTPAEMGYQQGMLARELIHGFRRAAYAYVLPQVPAPRPLALAALFSHAAAYWPTIPPEFAAEMRGIAAGAGVHPIEALVSTAIWEILLVSGCSEFAAIGPATADGGLIHGYNYDLMRPEHALIQPYLAALFYRPSHGIPFVTVNTIGTVGANAGMNEAGISVAWDNTYLKDRSLTAGIALPVVPFVITLRRLLQYAESTEAALRIVTGTLPRPLADIIIVGSAREGRAVALETAGHAWAVREMEGGAVWSTNCFRSPELAPYDRLGDGRGLDKAEAWRRFPRYCAYSELFAAHSPMPGEVYPPGDMSDRAQPGAAQGITPSLAASFLRDPWPREGTGYLQPAPAPRATICRDITSWSLVMQPGEGRIWVSDVAIPGCQGRFFAFDLPGWRRLPERDLPATGYRSALAAAERFVAGDHSGARAALAEASALDGPSAPLLLMQALLDGLAGNEPQAQAALQEVLHRWPASPHATLARTWLETRPSGPALWARSPTEPTPIPFPSAIRPLLHLRPASAWPDRAAPAPA